MRPLLQARALASLQITDYRWFWIASLASFMGMNMQMVARGWLVYDLTGKAMDVAWIMLAMALPMATLGLVGGAVTDRVAKRDLMAVAFLVNGLFMLVIAILIHMGAIQFWHLVLSGFFNGLVFAFLGPARMSFIPAIVGDRLMVNAIALNQTGMNLTSVVAPALAGLLIKGFGSAAVVFDVVGVLGVLSAGAMLLIRERGRPSATERPNLAGEIRDGLNYVRKERVVLALVVFTAGPMLLGFSYALLMPVFVADALGAGAVTLGVLTTVIGVGALGGSFLVALVGSFRGQRALLFGTALTWGAFIVLLALTPNAPVAAAVLLLAGLTGSVYGVLASSFMVMYARPEMRGRVMSLFMTAHGVMPLSLLPIGALADGVGVRGAYVACGVGVTLLVVLIYAFMPALRRLPPPPYAGDWAPPGVVTPAAVPTR